MADSEKKVGITIVLKDAVTAGAKKIKDGFESAKKSAKLFGDDASKSVAAIGKAVVVMNQGMELAKKAWGAINRTVGESIRMALEQRAATDGQLKAWTALSDRLQIIGGYIGDFFIPVILGIADAFEPTIKATETWAKELKKTQGSGFVEWLMSVGGTLISSVAKAVVAVSRTWVFLRLTVEGFQVAVNRVFETLIRGSSSAAGAVAALAEKVGAGGLASSMRSAQTETGMLADVFKESADTGVDEINRLLEEQMKLEQGIKETEAALQKTWGEVGPAVMARFRQEVIKTRKESEAYKNFVEGMTGALMEWENGLIGIREAREAMERADREAIENSRMDDLIDDQKKAAEAAKELAKQQKEAAKEAVTSMVDGYKQARGAAMDLFTGIAEGGDAAKAALIRVSQTLGELAEDFIAKEIAMAIVSSTTAKQEIGAEAAVGAAKAQGAYAGIPFVGAALGAAASALIFGLIMAFASKFQTGGVIGGNGRSGDRHIIMAEQGEAVLDRETTGALAAALSGRGRSPVSRGGGSSRGKSGGGGETHYHFESKPQYLAMPNSADYQRSYKDTVLPVQKRLQKIGAI